MVREHLRCESAAFKVFVLFGVKFLFDFLFAGEIEVRLASQKFFLAQEFLRLRRSYRLLQLVHFIAGDQDVRALVVVDLLHQLKTSN